MQPLKIKLTFAKSTKGTHVYTMRNEQDVEMGSVYLPKLVMPSEPPAALEMVISEPAKG